MRIGTPGPGLPAVGITFAPPRRGRERDGCPEYCGSWFTASRSRILLRAGAAIIGDVSDHFTWDPADYDFSQGTGLYFQKVVDAGGWKKFEQAHLAKLTKTFAPKFPMLPPEMVRHILAFGFHAGYY